MTKIYKTEKEAKCRKDEVLVPLYKKYKKKNVIDYCDCCGHKTGSHIEKIPVGKPYGYQKRKKTRLDILGEIYQDKIINNIVSEGIFSKIIKLQKK